MTQTKSDLPQGTLDLLILKVVTLGQIHGYAIAHPNPYSRKLDPSGGFCYRNLPQCQYPNQLP
jgi:hypothetical protein